MIELKVKDSENLIRDGVTGAILSKDEEEFLRYRKRKLDLLRELDKEREFNALKNEVKDLRALIVEIYEKIVNNK
jgi:predicted transcriptional regulator